MTQKILLELDFPFHIRLEFMGFLLIRMLILRFDLFIYNSCLWCIFQPVIAYGYSF